MKKHNIEYTQASRERFWLRRYNHLKAFNAHSFARLRDDLLRNYMSDQETKRICEMILQKQSMMSDQMEQFRYEINNLLMP